MRQARADKQVVVLCQGRQAIDTRLLQLSIVRVVIKSSLDLGKRHASKKFPEHRRVVRVESKSQLDTVQQRPDLALTSRCANL